MPTRKYHTTKQVTQNDYENMKQMAEKAQMLGQPHVMIHTETLLELLRLCEQKI